MPEEQENQETEYDFNTPFDSSTMFNERGFDKSNTFSYDETETINDFNGSLGLSFPLFNLKGPGDLNINLSLNYCSSLAHSIISSQTGYDDDGHQYIEWDEENPNFRFTISFMGPGRGKMPQYNFNMPGWLLSLNGMAIQVFNFEKDYFTKMKPESDPLEIGNIKDSYVKLLPLGHHITQEIDIVSQYSNRDKIYILSGDGSVESFYNANGASDPHYTTGKYLSSSKRNYNKGYVVSLGEENVAYGIYDTRRFSFMKGDGITYEYEEKRVSYKDFPSITYSYVDRFKVPKVFLLRYIKDRYGNKITINYHETGYGRPSISNITWSWENPSLNKIDLFQVAPDSLAVRHKENGSYKSCILNFDNDPYFERSYITSFVNLNGEVTHFGYNKVESPEEVDYIVRKAYGLHYGTRIRTGYNWEDEFVSIFLNYLKRLTSYTNVAGATRLYKYKEYQEEPFFMSYDDYPEQKIQSDSDDNYLGVGRDLFFTQMLEYKITKIGNSEISKEEFFYNYDDPSENRNIYPVEYEDLYTSERIIISLDTGSLNQTPGKFSTQREYKVYPVKDYSLNFSNHDATGEIKLISEKFYTVVDMLPEPEYNYIKEKYYSYVEGTSSGGFYNGSFLESTIEEKFLNLSKVFTYQYDHFTNTDNGSWGYIMSDVPEDNPIKSIAVTDPLLRKNVTNFDFIYKIEAAYNNFDARLPYDDPPQQPDGTSGFYFYLLIKKEQILIAPNGNYKKRERWDFIKETRKFYAYNTAYNGQYTAYNLLNVNNSDFLQTTYNYNKFDTVGQDLYTNIISAAKPTTEGTLKETISPKGKRTKYFYHPVDEYEIIGTGSAPMDILVKKILFDSTPEEIAVALKDRRFATRTDQILNSDYVLTTYSKHDGKGNLLISISTEKALSCFIYDEINRIKKVTTPYNFNENDIFDPGQGYTNYFEYDDVNNMNSIFTKLTNSVDKRVSSHYDGLYRIDETRLYTNPGNYLSNVTKYNYLNRISKATDPNGYSTKFSYDQYCTEKLIKNEDNSERISDTSFLNVIVNYFGSSYNGFIQKQTIIDEELKQVDKYIDAVGNLIRQVNYVPNGESTDEAITDFKYDDQNRVVQVKTSEGKNIYYDFDDFGRLKTKTTPDDGVTYFKYDKDSHVIFSQKNYVPNATNTVYNFYSYDGSGRLVGIGEDNTGTLHFEDLSEADEVILIEDGDELDYSKYLIINIYDKYTRNYSPVINFPDDYNSQPNYCLGFLTATASRTRLGSLGIISASDMMQEEELFEYGICLQI
ncbi:hypothetical protein BH10BAC5_BH10BAC5_02560 [soil metagenome]